MSAVVHPISENPGLKIARLVQLLVVRQRLAALDEQRTAWPVDHEYRHTLDVRADLAFSRLACECPDPCACEPTGGATDA